TRCKSDWGIAESVKPRSRMNTKPRHPITRRYGRAALRFQPRFVPKRRAKGYFVVKRLRRGRAGCRSVQSLAAVLAGAGGEAPAVAAREIRRRVETAGQAHLQHAEVALAQQLARLVQAQLQVEGRGVVSR